MQAWGPNVVLSSSPNSISFFEDGIKSLTLDEFKRELPRAIESIVKSSESHQPEETKTDLISDVFSRLHLDPNDLARHALFDPSKHYTRNLVATDSSHYTLLMLCWNPGKSSPIHDHPCDGCWMQVLEGSVRECRYLRKGSILECISDDTYHEGQQVFIDDSMGYHKVENPSLTKPAISLHLYCPPFEQCRIWMNPMGKSMNSKMTFHSEDGRLIASPATLASVDSS